MENIVKALLSRTIGKRFRARSGKKGIVRKRRFSWKGVFKDLEAALRDKVALYCEYVLPLVLE